MQAGAGGETFSSVYVGKRVCKSKTFCNCECTAYFLVFNEKDVLLKPNISDFAYT